MAEIEDLKMLKQRYTTKILWLCLSLVFVFLIPALLAVYFGNKLDNLYNGGEGKYVNFTLLSSFIFSWIIVIIYYKTMVKKIKNVDEQINKINNSTINK